MEDAHAQNKRMEVELPAEMAAWMDARISAGAFDSADSLIYFAIATLEARESTLAPGQLERVKEYRDKIQEGIDAADRGEVRDFTDEEFDIYLHEVQQRAQARHSA